jgi:chemotaxis protein histidine kinase CheA
MQSGGHGAPEAAHDSDWVPEFCEEVGGYVRELGELIALGSPAVSDTFRVMHTIKGAAGLSGLSEMERLAHAAELALENVRANQRALDPRLRHALSVTTAVMDQMLESLSSTGETGACPQRLLRTLNTLSVASRPPPATNIGTLLQEAGLINDGQLRAARLAQLAGDKRRIGEILVDSGYVAAPALQSALARQWAPELDLDRSGSA